MFISPRSAILFPLIAILMSCTPAPVEDAPIVLPPESGSADPVIRPPETGSVDPIIIAPPPAPVVIVEPAPVIVMDAPHPRAAAPEQPSFAAPVEEAIVLEQQSVETIDNNIEDGKYSEVTLFFATNRELQRSFDPDEPTSQFNNDNAPEVTYGTAVVSIPDTHVEGEIESQSWLESFIFTPNPEEVVILQNMIPRSRGNTLAMIDNLLETEDSILLYVHGFNTSMKKAALRSGQMTFDLKWNGPSMFFSWPSQANGLAYTVDQTMAERSERALVEVLKTLTERQRAKKIVIIAHSMGTHVLTQSLLRFHARDPDAARRITTVVLAAPDIDADIFINDIMPVFHDMPTTDVTLYASSKDTALEASHLVNGFPRIGDTEFGDDPLVPVNVVDASAAESNFFDHTYYGDNPRIIDDIAGFVRDGIAAKDRDTLIGVPDPTGPTWRVVAAP